MVSPGSRAATFQLPDPLVRQVEAEAQRLMVSKSAIVRLALQRFLLPATGSDTTAPRERSVA